MYAMTKLSKASQDFVTQLLQSNKSRSLPVCLAIARVLANKVSIPADPITDISQYYRLQAQANIENKVFFINELVVIDTKTTIDYAYKYFMFRYHAVHPKRHVMVLSEEHPISDFFGLNKAFGSEILDTIRDNRRDMCHYVNDFEHLYDCLWPQKTEETEQV